MPESSPLSPEQEQQLAEAGVRASRILAACKVATLNGWTLGIVAAISLPFAFGSLTALVMGVGLGWIAWNEFRGRDRLRSLDASAAVFLFKNQIALLVLIVAYALLSIFQSLTQPMPHLAEIEAMIGPVGDLVTSISVAIYVLLILLTILLQGLNARYYLARKAMIEEYLAETADWIVGLQRRIE